MSTANSIATILNSKLGNFKGGDISDLLDSFGVIGIFCSLFFISSLFNLRLKIATRLPIFRVIFWTVIITLDLIFSSGKSLETAETADYILALINSGLCLFYNTIIFSFYNGGTGVSYFEIFGISILAIALYEYYFIKLAIQITNKLLSKNKNAL
tara:strand:- start:1599 stop:2063 length:465 start_codon:yes stop_codon:yes gene_type:complete